MERKVKSMPSSLAQKLQIKPGVTIDIIRAPNDMPHVLQHEMPQNSLIFDPDELNGAVLIFLRTKAEVESIARPRFEKLDGSLPVWLAYPKGTSGVPTDINRDLLWKMLEPQGWRPARMIALDEVWSCMRFSKGIVKI